MEREYTVVTDFGSDIEALYIETNAASIVMLTYRDSDGFEYDVKGTSVRSPEDKFDSEVAYNLAMGRALENLANRFLKVGNGKTRHNDEVRARKQAAKEAKKDDKKPRKKKK